MSVQIITTFPDDEAERIVAYLQANAAESPFAHTPLAPDPSTLTVEQFVAAVVKTAMISVNHWASRHTGVP